MATNSKTDVGGKVRKKWTEEAMKSAVEAVGDGGDEETILSIRGAAKRFNVPVETLRRRVAGLVDMDCRPGPCPVFSKCEEERLSNYCIQMADMGFGLSKEDVMRSAFLLAEKSGLKHPFKNGKAGRAWFEGFLSRNPQLSIRQAQSLSVARATSANKETVTDFFGKLGSLYAKLNIIAKPMLIYNVDETGVTVVTKPTGVVTQVGRKAVYSIAAAEKGKTHTIMTCGSASGNVLPPMIIFPRERLSNKQVQGCVPGTLFACSSNGWIDQVLYEKWFDFFMDNLPPVRPVLLIEDGHSSHISISVIEKARECNIYILCLPAHTTHLLQPLDVGVFKSFKENFRKACHHLCKRGRVVTDQDITDLVAEAWPVSVTPVNLMSGFKKCGIYPLNPSEVEDRMLKKAPSQPIVPVADATSDTSSVCSSSEVSQVSLVTQASGSIDSVFNEVLKVPVTNPKKTQKKSYTTKARCITEDEFIEELKEEERKKAEKEEQKQLRKLEREKRKKEKEKEKQDKKTERVKRQQQKVAAKEAQRLEQEQKRLEKMKLEAKKQDRKKEASPSSSSLSSTCTCPFCGLQYEDESSLLWIQCDECGLWVDAYCADVTPEKIPDEFICENCLVI